MSITETRRPHRAGRSLPSQLHDLIEDAAWDRRSLDWLARRLAPGRLQETLLDRAPALRLTPLRRHKVSVVIPCFNYARFLPAAIGSALGQEHVDVEVVVVNDASTDDSLAVALHYEAQDSRVRVVNNSQNLGHVRSFNRGYERVRGEFVVRLDADDLLTPGSLARAVAVFERFPEVGLVYGHPRHFTAPEPPQPRIGRVTWSVWDGRSWVRERCRRGVNCITTPEAVIRASVMSEIGPLNTNLRFAQDMEMWLRVAAVSDVARIDDVDQALHRDHDDSMSVNEGSGTLTDLVERRRVFAELFRVTGHRFADAAQLHRQYRRTLANEAVSYATYEWDRGRHDPDRSKQLLDFARETCPEAWSEWDEVSDRLGRPRTGTAFALVRVAQRRVADELMYLRWSRTGL